MIEQQNDFFLRNNLRTYRIRFCPTEGRLAFLKK